MNCDMEAKGIVLRELSCLTCRRAPRAGPAELPPRPTPHRTCQLRRQFSSRSTPAGAAGKLRLQFSSRSTPPELPDCRRSFGIVLPELSRRAAAESPRRSCSSAGPQNLSYALIGEVGVDSLKETYYGV
ncbi:unnamed protein product [Boreogadus saida]